MSTVIARGQPSVPQTRVVTVLDQDSKGSAGTSSSASLSEDLGLGVPLQQKRFFWQRSKVHDEGAIATQPSVFDDPETAEKYTPRGDW